MFFPLHAVPAALAGKMSTTSSRVYTSDLNGGSKSTRPLVIVSSHQNQTGLNGRYAGLPGWAWLVIGIASAIVLFFVAAFAYHVVHDRRLSRAQNRKASVGRAAWKATKTALFLWVFIELAKCCSARKRRSGATSYRQVTDGKAEKTEMDKTDARTLSSVSITGGPTYQSYGDGGFGYQAQAPPSTADKYEPYKGASAAAGAATPDRRSASPPYSPRGAFKHLSAPTEYNPTTTISSTVPLMADSHLAGSSRPSTRDPSPIPSATYVPSQGLHGMY